MQAFHLTLLAGLLVGGESLRAVRVGVATASTYGADLANLAELEADDQRFWAAEFDGLEAQLVSLQGAAAAIAGPVNTTKQNNTQKVAAKAADAVVVPKQNIAKKDGSHSNPLAGLKLNLNPKSVADLVPALAMLKGLYEDGKERIAKLNAREKKYKAQFADKEAEHARRLARIEARFKNGTLSAEFHANETRDETRMFTYWQHVRERQHRQFHTSLKIQHGTMERVKTMMEMYEKTINGQVQDKAQVKQQLAKVSQGVMPDIMFLQVAWRDMRNFCSSALSELKAARREVAATTAQGMKAA